MKLHQFFKHLKIKATYQDNQNSQVSELEDLDIGDMDNAQNLYEKLVCKLYNHYLKNPEVYKDVHLYGKPFGLHKELIINNIRLVFSYYDSSRHSFNYSWMIEMERLDEQTLFPEYVDGKLAVVMYSFDVRKEYSDFVEELFNKNDDDLFADLL